MEGTFSNIAGTVYTAELLKTMNPDTFSKSIKKGISNEIQLIGYSPCTLILSIICLYRKRKKATTNLVSSDFLSLAMSYSHRGKPPTTIGARELNFRVRYGNGCDLSAIITRLAHIVLFN